MRMFLLVAFGSLILGASVVQAQSVEAPQGLKKEQSLPSRYPYVVQDILKYCQPQPGCWIDLGAGKGQVTIPLIEATDNAIIMVDPNVESLAKGLAEAREKGLQAKLFAVAGVAEDLPFLDHSVDLVVSRGAIFFFDDPAQGLREVYRVLRPGGKAYIGGGAGSGYPVAATEKLIAQRKGQLNGDEAAKWQEFVDLRRPEQMEEWAKQAELPSFEIMGKGAISAEDSRVGQGVWILFEKPAQP